MKKSIVKLGTVVLCIFGIIIGINSCDKDHVVDFHKIAIPEYTEYDYYRLLDNTNNDIVYNAISILAEHAGDYGKTLSNDTIKDTLQYKLAKDVYSKVSSHLKSSDEWVVCAAIRFMALFGDQYKNKDEVVEKLLGIKKLTKSIQLELIDGFRSTISYSSPQFEEKVKGFLKQKSWLVSRYSYQLLSCENNNAYNEKLIDSYKNTNKDFEKLLILQTIMGNFNDTVFSFVCNELVNSNDKKIHCFILKSLGNAKNKEAALSWINVNYKVINKYQNEIAEHYNGNLDSKFGSQLIIKLIEHGFNPNTLLNDDKEPKLYRELSEKLASFDGKKDLKPEDTEKLNHLKAIETAIVKTKPRDDEWKAYKEKHKAFEFPAELLATHKKQMEELMEKSKVLFDKYKIDPKFKDDYLSRLKSMDEDFYKKSKK